MSLAFTCQKLREAVSCLVVDGPLSTRLDNAAASLLVLDSHHPDGAFTDETHREWYRIVLGRFASRYDLSASAREQLARDIAGLLNLATAESFRAQSEPTA